MFSTVPSGKQGSVTVLDSNDVSVILHFTENQPREDVAVVVASVMSRNSQPITNYVLQAVVPKVRGTVMLYLQTMFASVFVLSERILICEGKEYIFSLKCSLMYSSDFLLILGSLFYSLTW